MDLSVIFQLLGVIAIGILAYTLYSNIHPVVVTRTPAVAFPPEMGETETVRFLFFSATWCPWSKKARPQWDLFKDDMKTHPVTFGGKIVQLEEVDGDTQPATRKQYGVTAYPSFKLVTPTGVQDMSTIPTRDGMRSFLARALGPEEPIQLTSGTK